MVAVHCDAKIQEKIEIYIYLQSNFKTGEKLQKKLGYKIQKGLKVQNQYFANMS